MKSTSFFFHYNKPASRAARAPKMSVHFAGACFIVDHVECNVPVKTKHNKRQPFCVLKGKLKNIEIIKELPDGLATAIIT